jgi:undecaprenyl-diphosphatase
LQAIVLGLVQGLTEFLPISSSGHLVLVPWILDWEDPGLAFDAMLHLGTLLAIVVFFWRDLQDLVIGGLASIRERSLADDPSRRGAWLIVVGSLPAALIGSVFEDFFETLFDAPIWVGVLLLVTGAVLAASEKWSRKRLRPTQLGWVDAVIIGLAQALAIAPGISRSGATISGGLWRGLQRDSAARFSFLLSVPIVMGAGLFKLKDLWVATGSMNSPAVLIAGFAAASVSGFLSIKFLLRYLRARPLYPFAAYCSIAGLLSVLLALASIR